ncbi:serine/threonine-protein kinase haspin homolog isoform X1 [Daucus carota subsp. sativus]|uniref:serine/threonine-protein kinase haspin homolog isoform X1 n=1 Tax=Daucus carota subsp. sativus TaxID=79200 RepID=UPI0007EF4B7D|nr:PREDICTED: serine/threonine-protein kinase haspin isoform X1 [Daucus carota subsp. sativus]
MASRAGNDLWSEIIAEEENRDINCETKQSKQQPEVAVIYRRKNAVSNQSNDLLILTREKPNLGNENRVSWAQAPVKRVSWNRALSTRGRTSIAVAVFVDHAPQQKNQKKKTKPAIPRGKGLQPTNYDKERAYFEEVDSFELLEESPSPKNIWTKGVKSEDIVKTHLSSVLEKWLIRRRLNHSCGPSRSLSTILGTPRLLNEVPYICDYSSVRTPEKGSALICSSVPPIQECKFCLTGTSVSGNVIPSRKSNNALPSMTEGGCEGIADGVRNLSLASRPSSLFSHRCEDFAALLEFCGQSAPSTLSDVFSKYCDPKSIVKVGEGTYGEAFKAGKTVCKVVPFDGDLRVNGEVQKRAAELFEEVALSRTLNHLRGDGGHTHDNNCTTFIQTIDAKVCQGQYDNALIRAWEHWDNKHSSENDHPKEFPEDQCYIIFVQEHGGQDLESFVLLNFDEARSLLVQVTVALAVGEAAYEFEHRDLHWGNILLSRKDSATLQFNLEGKSLNIRTFGLLISIIDFTLSRINTGEDILFLDLSSDPELFEGPKGDKQSDTYRKMKEATEDCWEESFPKTNVLWLQYLVDILLLKKTFDRTSKDERELRSLKKRLNSYGSAKEATADPFFRELFVDNAL